MLQSTLGILSQRLINVEGANSTHAISRETNNRELGGGRLQCPISDGENRLGRNNTTMDTANRQRGGGCCALQGGLLRTRPSSTTLIGVMDAWSSFFVIAHHTRLDLRIIESGMTTEVELPGRS
jgi:hypothetical protein